jgi:acetolactate synthase-1/2/3 large subunit
MIKVSDYIAKRLTEHGVKHVFMVSGGGAMHLNDSFGHCQGLTYICNHHEQASAIAAEGYARLHQKLAVVNVTTGPGGINALNGVFGQWTDSVPVLYISGQVKRQTTIASCPKISLRQLGDQEVDIINVVKPLVKYAKTITDSKDVKKIIDEAIFIAQEGRPGPVWVDVPIDVQAELVEEKDLFEYKNIDSLCYDNLGLKVDEAWDILCSSKRPLIIAGHGIRLAKAESIFRDLITRLKIPIVTTMNGFDIIESSHPLFIGRIGTVGQRAGNFALQNADLILCLGTRNNIRQISYNWDTYASKAKKIIVDIDLAELNKSTVSVDLSIHANVLDFIEMLLLKNINSINRNDWIEWCIYRKQKYSPKHEQYYKSKNNLINPYHFIINLTEFLSSKEVIVGGNGSAFLCPYQAGEVKLGQRYIWNSGNASMGYEIPAAIGACLANNKNNVICLAGDGSVMMNLQELQTIKHYNLPIKIFILNNDGYCSIQQTQRNFFHSRFVACTSDSGVTFPEFKKIAKAFDLPYLKLTSSQKINKFLKKVLITKGPVICEIFLEKGYTFIPKLSSRIKDDGTMVSPSLEDMFPFLSREEYEENMINEAS